MSREALQSHRAGSSIPVACVADRAVLCLPCGMRCCSKTAATEDRVDYKSHSKRNSCHACRDDLNTQDGENSRTSLHPDLGICGRRKGVVVGAGRRKLKKLY